MSPPPGESACQPPLGGGAQGGARSSWSVTTSQGGTCWWIKFLDVKIFLSQTHIRFNPTNNTMTGQCCCHCQNSKISCELWGAQLDVVPGSTI